MIRATFDINQEDYRPVTDSDWPWWVTGAYEWDDKFVHTMVAYAKDQTDLMSRWPEAINVNCDTVDEIVYTARFPKYSWMRSI